MNYGRHFLFKLLQIDTVRQKHPHGNALTTQAIAKSVGCSPQTDGEDLLLKATLLNLMKHGEVKMVPN